MFSSKLLFNANTESQNIEKKKRKLIVVRQSASMNRGEKWKPQNVSVFCLHNVYWDTSFLSQLR